jgi:hypothetical protein
MKPRRMLIWVPAALVLAFAAITWVALEAQEVISLRTRQADGGVRVTRVWVAEHDGALWLEAATPERAWYLDLLAQPQFEVERGGRRLCVVASPEPGPEGQRKIRDLLRQRYGWADRWVALLQDTSESIAVRLDPCRGSRG